MTQTNYLKKAQNIWDKTWRDSRGRIVIWQMPNQWLLGWAGMTVLSLLFSGRVADIFSWIASASLITWAFFEISQGVNYFRRIFGLVILVFSIASVIKSL